MNKKEKLDNEKNNNLSETYNKFKEFEGKSYTGMKIGRSHHWIYDAGDWKETKVTPDKWQISYSVTKRRKGKAPEGSGVPVGTKYHWYLFAHQIVQKLNANDYSTELVGLKYKIAHQRANKEAWNISETAQKKKLLKILQEIVTHLEEEIGTTVKISAKEKAGKTTAAIKNFPRKEAAKNEPFHEVKKSRRR